MNSGLHLLEVESVGDVVSRQEGGHQVGDGAGLATVGTKLEGVQTSLPEEAKYNDIMSYLQLTQTMS